MSSPFTWTSTTIDTIRPASYTRLYREIWVTFQVEGIHRYPAAAEDPKLADVAFLAHPHRHIFHFEVRVNVEHDDREIEFIQLKRYCQSLYSAGTLNAMNKSCEMLAGELIDNLNAKYPNRNITVSVSEDDENGATIYSEIVNA